MLDEYNCFTGIWTPPVGKRLRIAFGNSQNNMRAVVWVEVSSDVSIYLGHRILNYDHMKIGRKIKEGGEIFVGYDEGTQITDPKILKNNKISFHGSGIIHAGGGRSFQAKLRELRERQLLCYIMPQHPTKFPILKKIKRYDICLNYPIEENRPIMCHVYVATGENMLLPNNNPRCRLSSVHNFAL